MFVPGMAMKYEIHSMARMGFMNCKITKMMECAEEIDLVDKANEGIYKKISFLAFSFAHDVTLCHWALSLEINDFKDLFWLSERSICDNLLFRDYFLRIVNNNK